MSSPTAYAKVLAKHRPFLRTQNAAQPSTARSSPRRRLLGAVASAALRHGPASLRRLLLAAAQAAPTADPPRPAPLLARSAPRPAWPHRPRSPQTRLAPPWTRLEAPTAPRRGLASPSQLRLAAGPPLLASEICVVSLEGAYLRFASGGM